MKREDDETTRFNAGKTPMKPMKPMNTRESQLSKPYVYPLAFGRPGAPCEGLKRPVNTYDTHAPLVVRERKVI